MEKLKRCILSLVPIEKNSMDEILSAFEAIEITKGQFFLKSGEICNQMAFIESGYMRIYDGVNEKELTLWIGSKGKFITSISSFIFETNNVWNIQAITNCKLYVINREDHLRLNKNESRWLELCNTLLIHSFAFLEKSMFSKLNTTAKQRFYILLNEEPNFFKNVPPCHIASMLGISTKYLSKLLRDNIK